MLDNARAYAFRIEAVVLFFVVAAEIEAQVTVRDNVLALYLVVDYNTRFLERDAQALVNRLADRLRSLLPG